MRINVRLIAVLAGILMLGQIGGFLLRSLRFSGRSRSSSKGGGQATMVIVAVGLTLWIVGSVGVLFGRLIKAAISRQREYLADASAVQFTRNPDGVAGALWKIKEQVEGSYLDSSHAEDMSHMCFGESLAFSFGSMMSTHPPLDLRIKAIHPRFVARKLSEGQRAKIQPAPAEPPSGEASAAAMGFAAAAPMAATAAAITASVGNPTPEHVAYAAQLRNTIPETLSDAAHDVNHVVGLVYAMLLAQVDSRDRDKTRELIAAAEDETIAKDAAALVQPLLAQPVRLRLPLLEIALPTLKSLNADQRGRLLTTAEQVIKSDRRFTLFEFVLLTLLRQQLVFNAGRADKVEYSKYQPVLGEVRVLLTVLARVGTRDPDQANATFTQVMQAFDNGQRGLAPAAECTAARLTLVLRKLAGLSPFLKKSLLNACADCVLHDDRILPSEAELLRAIAASLDCPMPPLLG